MSDKQKVTLQCPINQLGYGIVGNNLLKELNKIADITLFPIGQVQPTSQEEAGLVQECANRQSEFDPSAPCIKVWHEHSLAERIGKGKYFGFPIFELNAFDQIRLKNLECCDDIVVCSNWARDIILQQMDIAENKVHVVPLGVDRNIFNESVNKVSENQCIFGNFGKWEVRKGHDVLFRAFKMAFSDDVKDVKLFMMCTNPFPQAAQQVQQFEQMYTSDTRVTLLPRVNTQQELAQIMGQIHCGIFPARAEGWNLELLEMMSMGKPVIATNYSGHTQFCNAENCRLIQTEKTEPAFDGVWFNGQFGQWASLGQPQVQQLADHMRDFYENWKRGNIDNPAGIETAKQFSWENTAQKLLEAISG